ncbi:aspartic peptidase A1 [Mycena floridula]|nr:aspartic peptidase A1 [Mycena floridula]
MFSKFFLAILALAVVAHGNPVVRNRSPITLPISRRFNFTGSSTILQRDQARAASLRARAGSASNKRAVISSPADNQAVTYISSIGIGNPATTYDLIIDTGSSNTWVGAGTPYIQTSTSTRTGSTVSVTYGSGSFSGNEFIDQVTIAAGLVIPKQSIGVATTSTGFDGVDGILGIGPVDLTQDTLSGGGATVDTVIPTVTDNLFSASVITENLVAVSFAPTTSVEIVNGELTWGGTDSTKFTGSVAFTPVTTVSPASFYWGIDQSITYGTSNTNILSSTAGIVDTGTTLVLIATDAFNRYTRATGAVADANTGLFRLTTAQFGNLQNLNFNINGVTRTLTPNGQIWPRALNTAIGGISSRVYLIVADLGSPSGEGFDFINGYAFLERFYSVFDSATNSVGFATTAHTQDNTN